MAKSGANPAGGGKQSAEAPASNMSFEDAVAALERIVEQIESGEIGLERAVAEYERGVALIARCRVILDQAEQRVTELTVPPDARARAAPKAQAPSDPDDSADAPF